MDTDLADKMIRIANRDRLSVNHDMRIKAKEFDEALKQNDVKVFLGSWARARRIYCDYTGEALI